MAKLCFQSRWVPDGLLMSNCVSCVSLVDLQSLVAHHCQVTVPMLSMLHFCDANWESD